MFNMFFSLTSADKTPSCKAPNQEISKHMPVLQQSNSSSNLFMCTSSYTVAYFLLFFNMFPVPGGCQIAEKITCGTNISYSILLYSANFDVSAWELVETYFSRKSDFPVVFFFQLSQKGVTIDLYFGSHSYHEYTTAGSWIREYEQVVLGFVILSAFEPTSGRQKDSWYI